MSHWYLDGQLCPEGVGFPSVTTILDVRANPNVIAWRERTGIAEADKYTQERQELGTAVHEEIEAWFKTRSREGILMPSMEGITLLHGFFAWFTKYQPTKCQSELYLQSDLHEYAGTADLICEIEGEPWLIDFKTSRHIQPSYGLQLAAYAQAYAEKTGVHCRRAVLQLTDEIKRGYRFQEFTNDDDFGIFMAHKAIHEWLELVNPRKEKIKYEEVML